MTTTRRTLGTGPKRAGVFSEDDQEQRDVGARLLPAERAAAADREAFDVQRSAEQLPPGRRLLGAGPDGEA